MKKELANEWKAINHIAKNGIPEYLLVSFSCYLYLFILILSLSLIPNVVKMLTVFMPIEQ